jgi:hypothetical protein
MVQNPYLVHQAENNGFFTQSMVWWGRPGKASDENSNTFLLHWVTDEDLAIETQDHTRLDMGKCHTCPNPFSKL